MIRVFYGLLSIYCWVHLIFIWMDYLKAPSPIGMLAVLAWSFALAMTIYRYLKYDKPYREKRRARRNDPNNYSV